jgi:hypothetical protein
MAADEASVEADGRVSLAACAIAWFQNPKGPDQTTQPTRIRCLRRPRHADAPARAAIWADALRGRGNDDYSVRLFPRGSHGLGDGGKTGSPLELLPELRWVSGYFDTMVKWVHHHAGGPAFPEARQVDVDAIPIESRGMNHVSWYGSGAVQPGHLLLS